MFFRLRGFRHFIAPKVILPRQHFIIVRSIRQPPFQFWRFPNIAPLFAKIKISQVNLFVRKHFKTNFEVLGIQSDEFVITKQAFIRLHDLITASACINTIAVILIICGPTAPRLQNLFDVILLRSLFVPGFLCNALHCVSLVDLLHLRRFDFLILGRRKVVELLLSLEISLL